MRAEDNDEDFAQFCEKLFTGKIDRVSVLKNLASPYNKLNKNLRWLPGRVMVKDVHSYTSLDWIVAIATITTYSAEALAKAIAKMLDADKKIE